MSCFGLFVRFRFRDKRALPNNKYISGVSKTYAEKCRKVYDNNALYATDVRTRCAECARA